MPPRKSLPASRSTPKRSSLPTRSNTSIEKSSGQAISTPTRPKRSRPSRGDDDDHEATADGQGDGPANVKAAKVKNVALYREKELEAWQDFAADHYEMVEQLPLELHRSFRLLRELDDTCVGE